MTIHELLDVRYKIKKVIAYKFMIAEGNAFFKNIKIKILLLVHSVPSNLIFVIIFIGKAFLILDFSRIEAEAFSSVRTFSIESILNISF